MCAIKSLNKEKKKKKSLQPELNKKEEYQNSKDVEQTITKLKIQVEEDKKIDEALIGKLDEKERIIEGLEAKIVTLRKYL
jgi:hypothetical protein